MSENLREFAKSIVSRSEMGVIAARLVDAFKARCGDASMLGAQLRAPSFETASSPWTEQHTGDGADCFGITHTALDGRTFLFAQYVRIFVDHK